MTPFERMEKMFNGNVGRIASAIDDFHDSAFAGYNPESRVIRMGKERNDCWSYCNPLTSVVRMREGKEGRIDVLFESYKRVRVCDDGSNMDMRTYEERHWYQGETACKRALQDAAHFMGVPPRFLQAIYEEVVE